MTLSLHRLRPAWPYIRLIAVAVVIATVFLATGLLCGAETAKPAFSVSTDGRILILTPIAPLKFRLIQSGPNSASGVAPAIVDGVADLLDWQLLVTFGDQPRPDPKPEPEPKPKPDPLPTPTTLWGVVIEESAERTAGQAVVILSPKVAALFDGKIQVGDAWKEDGTRRPLGPLDPYADRVEELEAAAKTKLRPMLFVVDPKGAIFYEGKLPGKVADVETLVGKIRKGEKP